MPVQGGPDAHRAMAAPGEIKVPDLKVSAGKGSLRILYVLYVFLDSRCLPCFDGR